VRSSIWAARAAPTPPSRGWPNASTSADATARDSPLSNSSSYPSLTTTIEKSFPFVCRLRISSQQCSTVIGSSGIRITSAPPAIPAITAIQPVWRPITSHTITRSCDSAVECRRSMASVAIVTAVSKPNV